MARGKVTITEDLIDEVLSLFPETGLQIKLTHVAISNVY